MHTLCVPGIRDVPGVSPGRGGRLVPLRDGHVPQDTRKVHLPEPRLVPGGVGGIRGRRE